MATINLFQVPPTMKRSTRQAARWLLVGLVVLVASALAGCGGESALFARDGATGQGSGGNGGTAGSDAGSDLGSSDATMDQKLDQAGDGISCSNDSECATTQLFCSAGACVPRFGNLAGNGDLEYGSTAGWYGVFGSGGSFLLSDTTAAGYAHGGRYSAQAAFRTQLYHGPAYRLPTGLGKYILSGWAFQKDAASLGVGFQVVTTCATTIQYFAPATASVSQNVWTFFSATVDTSSMATTPAGDCSGTGTTPGGVKLQRIVVNQSADVTTDGAVVYPDLFMDDLVVQVTDGHNLVGNSNFEGGFVDGWTGGGATVAVSSTQAKIGTHSLSVSGRTLTTAGPSYAMPLGAGKYTVVFQGMHTGTSSHGLVLQATYTCLGGAPTITAPIATAAGVAGNAWTQLSGTVALPPADAPPGCRLTDAAVYMRQAEIGTCGGALECPDLYVDDVSVVIPP